MADSNAGLVLRGVTKRFPGVVALDGVEFQAHPGEVHALVGGNGAGKSTLMAVASGALAPDAGTVEIAGSPMRQQSPIAAREQGLAIAFQHPALLPDLTVTENLLLSVPKRLRPSFGNAQDWAREQLLVMGMDIDPAVAAGRLTLAEKQAVEICGAFACEPSVLILDEPTEPFMAAEIERLFEQVRLAAARGMTVIYISHRLPDVMALSDRLTVLRDGQVRGTFLSSEVSEQEVITRIAGREIEALFPPRPSSVGDVVMEVRDLRSDRLRGITTTLARNEVLGLAGVEGNGQRDFIRSLGGADPVTGGDVIVSGRPVDLGSPRRARRAGVVLMPQERHVEGVATVLSVKENLGVAATGQTAVAGVVRGSAENSIVAEEISRLGIKVASPESAVEHLSGGNQQKVVLGRALLSAPKVLLCDEPTQGIDVGVRSDIYHRLRSTAESGTPVVVLSSDNVELAGLCDRVLVFSQGRVVRELTGDEISDHSLTEASLTAATSARTAESSVRTRGTGLFGGVRRLLSSEQAPSAFLAIAIVLLAAVSATRSDRFLSEFNIASMLGLLAPVLFLAAGQLVVILTGGIDLSVGPLSGALVVIASFYILDGYGAGWWILGFLLMILMATGVGLANGAMVRFARVTPVVATLVTYTALQGFSLFMRDSPGGSIATSVTEALSARIGPIPWAVIVGAALLVLLEVMSRRSMMGLRLRGAGSSEHAARNRGIPVARVHLVVYLASALFTVLGALLLMAQIGVGDPTAGISYTMAAITAVVLGGASIFGGRGSFVGVLFGVVLLQLIQNTTVFLGLSQSWQYWMLGLMALGATAVYSQVRTART
ncbi:ATP-binding cassette domain-containing protein [Streptosporangium sp. NPDC050280]|uniref:ATP-binding cassette domain-containing protein n=1 Tax=unclassified Streptosporangium TaxID=2632669 RepID=UPI00342C338E